MYLPFPGELASSCLDLDVPSNLLTRTKAQVHLQHLLLNTCDLCSRFQSHRLHSQIAIVFGKACCLLGILTPMILINPNDKESKGPAFH